MTWLTASILFLGLWIPHAVALKSKGRLKHERDGAGIHLQKMAENTTAEGIQFKHRIRVCNVYPSASSFIVFLKEEQLTNEPLSYKSCQELTPRMKAGDRLNFKMGNINAGSFAVTDLPNNDAMLVLVVYRHNTLSTAVAFESHIFANLINGQIAVLDTYKGDATSKLRIQDTGGSPTTRSEELRYDTVVAVNPGIYEIVAQADNGEIKVRRELVALNRESYVVIRCGVEAENGKSSPQDLVIFPRSDVRFLTGSAAFQAPALTVILGFALASLGQF